MGNLLGATLDDAAKTASNVGMLVSSSIGLLNGYVTTPQYLFPMLFNLFKRALDGLFFCDLDSQGSIDGRIVLFVARKRWGYLFNDDPEVVELVAQVMPYCAIFQVRTPYPPSTQMFLPSTFHTSLCHDKKPDFV